MSKAIQGAALLGAAVGMGALAFFNPALLASPAFDKLWAGLILSGISMEAGAIAGALTANRGQNISTRQPSANRQVIYGVQRVGGVIIYRSTTGSHHDQYNFVIVLATHEVDSIENLYLDGRKVFWAGGTGNVTRNGVNFGGAAAGGSHVGPGGQNYDFGGLVYCEGEVWRPEPWRCDWRADGQRSNLGVGSNHRPQSVGGWLHLCVSEGGA